MGFSGEQSASLLLLSRRADFNETFFFARGLVQEAGHDDQDHAAPEEPFVHLEGDEVGVVQAADDELYADPGNQYVRPDGQALEPLEQDDEIARDEPHRDDAEDATDVDGGQLPVVAEPLKAVGHGHG